MAGTSVASRSTSPRCDRGGQPRRAGARLGRVRHRRRGGGPPARARAARGGLVHPDRLDGLRPLHGWTGRASHRALLPHDRSRRGRARRAGVDRLLVAVRALQRAAILAGWRGGGRSLVGLPRPRAQPVREGHRLRLGHRDDLSRHVPLRATLFARARVTPWRPSPRLLGLAVTAGTVSVAMPLLFVSAWLVPLVWAGWALLLEPLNYRRGRPSWLADLALGDASRLLALLAAGAICGVLWEFWNYWAATRWTYSVPYLGS